MARLKVRLRGKAVSEIPLAEDRQYLAGRKDGCDIHLQGEKGISREHFRISCVNGTWTVETLSRFGELLLAGEKVGSLTLEHGMAFSVPPYEFEFLMTSADSPMPSHEAVPVADGAPGGEEPSAEGQLQAPAAAAISDEAMEEKTVVGVAPSTPYIKIMGKDGEAKELIRLEGGDLYLAGRDSTCNIHIRDQRVSRRQFEIRKSGSQYSIIDLGSVNGTLLNGNPISSTDPTPLKSGDAISVLENYLYFELHDPNFRSRLELVNLQPALNSPLVPLDPAPQEFQAPVPMMAPYPNMPVAWQGAQMPMPYQAPPPMAPMPLNGRQTFLEKLDWPKNKVKILIGAVALIVIGFQMFGGGGDDIPKQESLGTMSNDPFSKLTPEQKKLVKDTFQLAKSYYMQGRFEFARSELTKMQEIVPTYNGSEGNSDELMRFITEAIEVQRQQKKQEELERARQEAEEKIQRKAAECRKLIAPEVTKEQMENCLVEVIPLNPAHPLFAELFAEVEGLLAEKRAREARDAAHRADVERLRGLYGAAKGLENKNKPLSAIAAYQRVVASELPDPNGLKGAARGRIADLKAQVDRKTADFQAQAKRFEDEGNLKQAILTLRKAREIDPHNPYLLPRILSLKDKLQEQMMTIYQEGILEESFGNVEGNGDENKLGAKQKWKQIIKLDVPDGEYYKKAYIKLKKYGSAQ